MTYQAGRKEKGDIFVEFLPGETITTIELKSPVEKLYGFQIKETIKNTLRDLDVRGGHIAAEDFGALDWVIQARVEAVVRKAGIVGESLKAIPKRISLRAPKRQRGRRTRLYLPGNNPDYMVNAGLFKPDCVVLDLEDSVPKEEKETARILVRNALRTVNFYGSERIVRINPFYNGETDIREIVVGCPDVVLIPKCEKKEDVAGIDFFLERTLGEDYPYLMPLIETAKGVLNAHEIAFASGRIVAICFGEQDFCKSIGVKPTREREESFVARSMIVLAANAAGVQPLDSPYANVDDEEGLAITTFESWKLGFQGRGVIHPQQIQTIHEIFQPTEEEIEHARRVIVAFEKAQREGRGVVSLDGKMIEAPVVAQARMVLEIAERMEGSHYEIG